ncbi:MAG: 4-diphosphocytidyl-2-C-methyl-D-erythritol kinase [Lentimonas sp.]
MSNDSNTVFQEVSLHSPAKINLMLSVHGRRSDGFHELTSLMVALKFGDTLTVRITDSGEDTLVCSNPEVPVGSDNLVLKAAKAFRARLDRTVYFEFKLEKRIPMGAGFGGGSGNAVAALSGMNQLLGSPLKKETLYELAADLGSDCSFFIEATPAWTFGRGEQIEPLDAASCKQLSGIPVVLFKPNFGVNTAWAYKCLAADAPENYLPDPVETSHLEESIKAGALNVVLNNSFETPVGKKYVALPTLLDQLRTSGVVCMMSGSGSGCFALPGYGDVSLRKIKEMVANAWGEEVFWVETSIC